jgi:hypothetical protein
LATFPFRKVIVGAEGVGCYARDRRRASATHNARFPATARGHEVQACVRLSEQSLPEGVGRKRGHVCREVAGRALLAGERAPSTDRALER